MNKSFKLLIVGVVSAAAIGSGAGMAQAQTTPVEKDPLSTVQEIIQKSPGVVQAGSTTVKETAVIGAIPSSESTPLTAETPMAAIAAVDGSNSVVSKSKETQSLITVLRDGATTADFKYSVPKGFVPEINADGSVQLRQGSVIIPFVAAPWALDANGKSLKTSYSLVGETLRQEVNTAGAAYPVIADPSLQWVPFPVIAMWGAQANGIAQVSATLIAAPIGSACVMSWMGGWMGKAFSVACGLVGFSGARDLLVAIGNIWSSQPLNPSTCYGFPVFGLTRDNVRVQPASDCS